MRIAITGGTGFIGRTLIGSLLRGGHSVLALTRTQAPTRLEPDPSLTVMSYDPYQPQSWASLLEGCEGIVNLAGEPLIGSRWTPEKKDEIRRSRIERTRCLVEAIGGLAQKPQVLVSGSAVGYYGPQAGDVPLDESASPASDFLAQVTIEWEAAAEAVQALGVRLAILRTGIVLGPDGGALGQMLGPFQLFVGGPIGSGKQWLSWIHRNDIVRLIEFALFTPSVSGILNGTAPTPVQMAEFCQTLGQVIGRPSWLPVPALALELLLGEAAQVVLSGQRVLPKRAEQAGFSFDYPTLKPALREILVRP